MARGINKFFTLTKFVTITINRSTGVGDFSDTTGLYTPAGRVTLDIQANIQPFKASQTLLLPESARTKEWLNVWSTSEIRKAEEGSHEADTFIYNNKKYKVMDIKSYGMGVLDHYHAHAALDSPTPVGVNING